MTHTPISDSTIFHFCRFFTLNALANFDIFQKKSMNFTEKLPYVVVYQ